MEIVLPQEYEDVNSGAIRHLGRQILPQTVPKKAYCYHQKKYQLPMSEMTGSEIASMYQTWTIHVRYER